MSPPATSRNSGKRSGSPEVTVLIYLSPRDLYTLAIFLAFAGSLLFLLSVRLLVPE